MNEKKSLLSGRMNEEMCKNPQKLTYGSMCGMFSGSGIDPGEAAFEVSLMIGYCAGYGRAKILAERDFDYFSLGDEVCGRLLSMIELRTKFRRPIQYILGEWEFMGHTFKVGEGCLIPRQDTEILCEYAVRSLPEGGTFADLCSGSGCIAVSILLARPDIKYAAAVEISPAALKYLKLNAENLGVADRLEIIRGDVRTDVFARRNHKFGKFDMIVSNPPYIPGRDISCLSPELSYEPRLALDGGEDGLDIIKKIIEIYPEHTKTGGEIALEFGIGQSGRIAECLSGRKYTVFQDYNKIPRIAVAVV